MNSRYHPALVLLHWLLAAAVIGMLLFGFTALSRLPNSDPGKLDLLRTHMALGMGLLALMLARLVVRLATPRPPPLGPAWSRAAAAAAHWLLYALVVGMAVSGLATALSAHLNDIVFARSGDPLPPSFVPFPAWQVHRTLAFALAALVLVHLGAVIWHLGRGENVMSRMGFGGPR